MLNTAPSTADRLQWEFIRRFVVLTHMGVKRLVPSPDSVALGEEETKGLIEFKDVAASFSAFYKSVADENRFRELEAMVPPVTVGDARVLAHWMVANRSFL